MLHTVKLNVVRRPARQELADLKDQDDPSPDEANVLRNFTNTGGNQMPSKAATRDIILV